MLAGWNETYTTIKPNRITDIGDVNRRGGEEEEEEKRIMKEKKIEEKRIKKEQKFKKDYVLAASTTTMDDDDEEKEEIATTNETVKAVTQPKEPTVESPRRSNLLNTSTNPIGKTDGDKNNISGTKISTLKKVQQVVVQTTSGRRHAKRSKILSNPL